MSKQSYKTSITYIILIHYDPHFFFHVSLKLLAPVFTPVCTKTNKLRRKCSYGDTLLPYITKIISLISSILKGEIEIVLMRGNIIHENVLIFQVVWANLFPRIYLTICCLQHSNYRIITSYKYHWKVVAYNFYDEKTLIFTFGYR